MEQGAADLKRKLEWLVNDPDAVAGYRSLAVERIVSRYQWEQVVDAHEQLYARLLGGAPATNVEGQSGELALPASKEQS
jgi:glycosyltransferase involved in cell wall biosynthesis